jgi:hypothetical protein
MIGTKVALFDLMNRIACAARGVIYARDFSPGDDLGQEALACCMLELRAAVKDLEAHTSVNFDVAAYVAELVSKQRNF